MPVSPPIRGTSRAAPFSRANQELMTGTAHQIEWAVEIKARVGAEFDRVANALDSAAGKQTGQKRTDTKAMIAILNEKRAGVMARDEAGYFIQEWQGRRGEVPEMIAKKLREH